MNNMKMAMQTRAEVIRCALMCGENPESIALRLGTSLQAVNVVAKGLRANNRQCPVRPNVAPVSPVNGGGGFSRYHKSPATANSYRRTRAITCPLKGKFVSIDGTNVSGWSRRKGEPRLTQTLAVCRYFAENDVRFTCWFDANFRHCLAKYSQRDAVVLDRILREEPAIFKIAPAGVDQYGEKIKADKYVLRDAESVNGGMVMAGDLYRKEVKENAEFAWVRCQPERRITGQISANGDVFIDNFNITIPVSGEAEDYIK